MDVKGRADGILLEARRRYAAGEIDVDEMRDVGIRASRLKSRDHFRRVRGQGKASRDRVAIGQIERLAAVLARGGTVTAFDVGSNPNCVFDEVGVSTWRAGAVETVNMADEAATYRHPDPAIRVSTHPLQVYRPSLYGTSLALPQSEILDRAREAAAGADMLVFHSVWADAPKLGIEVDHLRLADTETMGWIWCQSCPSLAWLCARSGIDVRGQHNSGNDAYYALRLAIALAGDDTVDMLRAREALRARRDTLRRAMIMRPTRIGGMRGAQAEWQEACRAVREFRADRDSSEIPKAQDLLSA